MQDFRIKTAVPQIMGGLDMALGAYNQYKDREIQKEKLVEGAQLLQSGTPEQVAKWNMENPGLAQQFIQAANIQDQFASKPRVELAKDILSGRVSAREGYQKRLEEVEAQGGDISMLRDMMTKSDEELQRMAELDLSLYDHAAFNNYMKATSPPPAKETTIMQNLKAAGLVPGTKEYQDAILEYVKKPSGTQITIGDAKTLEKATEGQLSAAGFASRVGASNKALEELERVYDPTNLGTKIAESIPGGNILLSDKAQEYRGAKEDFITAVLRKESGAVISDSEFEREDRKYFPQPGDSKKTVELKRKRRERQFEVLKNQSKGVYDIQYAESDKQPDDARSLPKGVTEQDIEFTMKKHGVTREQVLNRIRGQ